MNDKILIVDDEERILDALKRQLSGVFDIETAVCPVDALNRVRADDSYSVIVSDYRMPGLNGIEFLKTVKTVLPNSSRIMLTGQGDLETVVNAINESNVDWYLEKPASKEKLCEVLDSALKEYEKKSKVSQSIKSLNKEIIGRRSRQRRLASLDPSSGLVSRMAVAKLLRTWHEVLTVAGRQEALIVIDIDNFRAINADLGLEAAEAIIRTVGDRIKKFVDKNDTFGRWDSDSFVITTAFDDDLKSLEEILEELIDFIATPCADYGRVERFSVSAGATVSRGDPAGIAVVVSEAEAALAEAKLISPANYVVYDRTKAHLPLSPRQPPAVDEPMFSPRMHIASGRIVGGKIVFGESAVKFNISRPGLDTSAYCPEREAAYNDLHRLYETLRLQKKWREQGAIVPIALEVSVALLESEGVYERIAAALDHFKVSAEQLEFEVADGNSGLGHDRVAKNIESLFNLGIGITLANFGTTEDVAGNMLQTRFHKIKLDKRILSEMETNDGTQAFIRWVAALAHERGYELVCDGLENDRQRKVLRDCGCDYVEGPIVSGLLPGSEFLKLAGESQRQNMCG